MIFPPAFHVLEELPGDDIAPPPDLGPRPVTAPLAARAVLRRREITQSDLDHAREEGIERGRAATVAQYEMKLQEERQTWAGELQAARDAWEEAMGQQVWGELERALEGARHDLSATLVEAVRPFIRRKLTEGAVEEMTRSVFEILSKSPDMTVSIVGPARLVEAFEEATSGRASVSATIDNSRCELVVNIGASVMSTRLAEWLGKLELDG